MEDSAVPAYLSEIKSLKEKYTGEIEIYCGMEVDFIPDVTAPKHPEILRFNLNYTIGSVHYGGM